MAVEHARDRNCECPHCGTEYPTPTAAAYCCLEND